MKKYFLFITTGSIILFLNSCREHDTYTDETEKYVTDQNTFKRDSTVAKKIGETDPPKDRDNWRMSQ
ncbi:hypothetical protein EG346_02140 [Chryseobacterium carnipullorum]|uniref:Uncharacterized protein n=1 Tax=Chryseobacterium carnipullorum TaxID=1124835 RepID=A0A376EFS2_CHRCU|nr:hypothetical protein [Chryseobacterium carnipullorum]AZA47069.1 hypothetical protein EG346_02140 [Chryseobacterium carnipullorum]AZA66417.1 hypothetical protein EG345_18245 [Chryseobacterium carnipullorum]STD07665.1 Uncharacterised protein [Chryseobacterium carnipullorum]